MKKLMTCMLFAIFVWLSHAGATSTYNDGQWHASTSYMSVYVASTTYSTQIAVVTQGANVVVTLTSYIPCPVTSTTWVYVCSACPTTVAVVSTQQAVQTVQTAQTAQAGTTTVTRYTTETPRETVLYQTVTSGGYVIVIANPTTAAGFVNSGHSDRSISALSYWVAVAGVLVLSILCP